MQKSLICSCLPDSRKSFPHGEEDMDTLHMVLSACDLLKKIKSADKKHWLSYEGRNFPDAARKFIYRTAIHFHQIREESSRDVYWPFGYVC